MKYTMELASKKCGKKHSEKLQQYHLNCDVCGEPYWSKDGFPIPQICPKCTSNMKNIIKQERIIDLQKYTLGELMEAIEKYHSGINVHKVNRNQLVSYPVNYKTGVKTLSNCGGPAFVIVMREGNLSNEDIESIDPKQLEFI